MFFLSVIAQRHADEPGDKSKEATRTDGEGCQRQKTTASKAQQMEAADRAKCALAGPIAHALGA